MVRALLTIPGLIALALAPTSPTAADERTEAVVLLLEGSRPDEAAVVEALHGPAELSAGPQGMVQVEVTDHQRAEVAGDPQVAQVLRRGATVQLAVEESVPLVGAPGRWAEGHTGEGSVVVVIDTGVSDGYGGALVGQACFAGDSSTGFCGPAGGVYEAYDGLCFELGVCQEGVHERDPSAGRPCSPPGEPVPESCQHGTAVAATVARSEAPSGVAPGAAVYAIRVFDPNGVNADVVDIALALAHVRDLVDAGLEVAAVNLSVSTGQLFLGTCDGTTDFGPPGRAVQDLISSLRARGVAPVIASGNSGSTVGLGFPACLSGAVAVGATLLDDRPASFSNRGPGLELFAPGARSEASALVIPSADGFLTRWAGTSFAAPHAAGGFAVLAEEYQHSSVADRLWFLRAAGAPVAGTSVRRMGLGPPSSVLNAGLLFPSSAAVGGADRVAVVDLDGDGYADVVSHGFGTSRDDLAWGGPRWALERQPIDVEGAAEPLVGDFTGPAGAQDVLWYAAGPAADALLVGRADRQLAEQAVTVRGAYEPEVGDFDGDGWDDILWYAAGPAADSVWFGGPTGFSGRSVSVRGDYRLVVGDFDGDGRDDVLFHGPGRASDFLWSATATRGFRSSALSMNGTYTPVVGDFDGDLDSDLLLYQPGAAADYLWIGGPTVGSTAGSRAGFGQVGRTINGDYTPLVADLEGDGRDDVVWYQPGPGFDAIWLGRPGPAHTSRTITVSGSYRLRAGDFDGSGGDDLLWFDADAARSPLWWSHLPTPG